MAPVKRQTLSDQVIARIKRYIAEKGLKAGDRLPTEQELADEFGVSRISIREATKALGFLGIIQAAPKRGLTVGQLDMKRVAEYLGFHFALNDYPRAKLLQARIVVETGALPFTMDAIDDDPELYTRLVGLVDRLDDAEDLDQFIEGEIAFHRALVAGSGIEPLVAFADLLHAFFRQFRDSVAVGERHAGNQGHRQILVALRTHKLAAAQQMLARHLEYHKRFV
jgi:GntR family transcriptional regulator, transcriptional repressor for pyruvate dehydrogenase complex